MAITVALIEDTSATRQQLESLLGKRADLRLVASCCNAEDARERLPKLVPQVVVCDIMLPGASGIQCVQALHEILPETQFLMLTVVEDYDEVFQAILAGATGYLLKTEGLDRVPDAVVELHAGGSPMSTSIARKVIEAFQHGAHRQAAETTLSERERQVLDRLARGRIHKEIADDLGVSVATIRSHIFHIYKKLQVRTRTEAVRHWRLPFGWGRK
jgi:DNA-binding NarL/FixJ family response regulator